VKKTFLIVAALVSLTALAFAGNVLAFEITIDVAPNVLNLQRTNDKCVTVHTNISFNDVDCSSVALEVEGNDGTTVSILRDYCKSDDRGNFVAKFLMEDIRKLPLTTYEDNTFKLIGDTKDGVDFWGSQDILVVDNPKDS
jgi:hypothetical protein